MVRRIGKRCGKVPYPTRSKARKALRKHGYAIGCRRIYRCLLHGEEVVYHLTSQEG